MLKITEEIDIVHSVPDDNLAERLKAGALANFARDLEIAQEWFPLEEEAWEIAEKSASERPK